MLAARRRAAARRLRGRRSCVCLGLLKAVTGSYVPRVVEGGDRGFRVGRFPRFEASNTLLESHSPRPKLVPEWQPRIFRGGKKRRSDAGLPSWARGPPPSKRFSYSIICDKRECMRMRGNSNTSTQRSGGSTEEYIHPFGARAGDRFPETVTSCCPQGGHPRACSAKSAPPRVPPCHRQLAHPPSGASLRAAAP